MIGPVLRNFIILMANNRLYMCYSQVINEVEETGTAHVTDDGRHTTFIYDSKLKKWVEKTPADELLHAVNKRKTK